MIDFPAKITFDIAASIAILLMLYNFIKFIVIWKKIPDWLLKITVVVIMVVCLGLSILLGTMIYRITF